MTKILHSTVKALPGQKRPLEILIETLAKQVRKEGGNIKFEVYRQQDDVDTFQMLEVYQDETAFQKHLSTDYVQEFNQALQEVAENDASTVISLEAFAGNHPAAEFIRGIDHVGVTVPSIEQASAFFEEAFGAVTVYDVLPKDDDPMAGKTPEHQLGIPEGSKIVHMRLMRIGEGPSLEMFQFEDTRQSEPHQLSDFGLTHFAVYVDDILEVASRFKQAGGTLLSQPHALAGVEASDRNAGVYARTPWGMLVELITYPDGIDYAEDATTTRWTPQPENG